MYTHKQTLPDLQSAFTGAVEAGATQFMLSEELAAEWSKLAAVDIYTYQGVKTGPEVHEFLEADGSEVERTSVLGGSETSTKSMGTSAGSRTSSGYIVCDSITSGSDDGSHPLATVKSPDGSDYAVHCTLETGDDFQRLQDRCGVCQHPSTVHTSCAKSSEQRAVPDTTRLVLVLRVDLILTTELPVHRGGFRGS
jgi:hypothetical protein